MQREKKLRAGDMEQGESAGRCRISRMGGWGCRVRDRPARERDTPALRGSRAAPARTKQSAKIKARNNEYVDEISSSNKIHPPWIELRDSTPSRPRDHPSSIRLACRSRSGSKKCCRDGSRGGVHNFIPRPLPRACILGRARGVDVPLVGRGQRSRGAASCRSPSRRGGRPT